jgi:hypothetical protein
MSYRRAILQRFSDNVARTATITITSGSIATGYLLSYLTDNDPSRPAKFNEATLTLLFDWGGAQRQDAVSLIHANLAAGLAVRYQCNPTNSWTAPALDVSVVIPEYKVNKYPTNSYTNLVGQVGYQTAGYRYARLVVSGTNPVPIAIGELVIVSEIREIEWLANTQVYRDQRMTIDHSTDAGVTNTFDLGVNIRAFQGSTTNRPAQKAALDRHWQDARGRTFPFLFVPNALGDPPEPWLARWLDPVKEDSYIVPGITTLTLKLVELGRGLYPTPSVL